MPIHRILENCITQNYDFGTAYAYLCHDWIKSTIPRFTSEVDLKTPQNIIVNGLIHKKDGSPRRVWGLYANWVVPYWITYKMPWGISHAWMDENDRVQVWTPINQEEWPVPIPKDADLALIRIEMLNLGAELVWLDVLCLRQPGGRGEHLRRDEWKVDVPTIGFVYQNLSNSEVVCYFSGLGQPLSLKAGDFESKLCWFNRAWTLQEITEKPIIGGGTGDNVMMEEDVRMRFNQQLGSLQHMAKHGSMFDVLSEMRKRVSTKPLDKVAGLANICCFWSIPIYREDQSDEEAWTALVNAMLVDKRAELLFFYPEPGDGSICWRPSWKQVMTKTLPSPQRYRGVKGGVGWAENVDLYEGPCINLGDVQGLSDGPQGGMPREGRLIIKDHTGTLQTIKIIAEHEFPIPDGPYTLIGGDAGYNRFSEDYQDFEMM
ncbi:uncharacterized protein EV420DRAFT_1317299 [Desarmillaria tabescens]|uniref:Heterokaryon incompatibility domain-containing protein n=1 Tax=Armillaria tabescens TaxID=1929756 RepID=A0AA39J666_ARMTA|nr:uncharacterized protein EV420DRAFT_1317299 [Desarmillaria tabescens]KAK0436808.1 hypothetical protein EV420DRAFT_1317299 [Desarmillaria tabescens]